VKVGDARHTLGNVSPVGLLLSAPVSVSVEAPTKHSLGDEAAYRADMTHTNIITDIDADCEGSFPSSGGSGSETPTELTLQDEAYLGVRTHRCRWRRLSKICRRIGEMSPNLLQRTRWRPLCGALFGLETRVQAGLDGKHGLSLGAGRARDPGESALFASSGRKEPDVSRCLGPALMISDRRMSNIHLERKEQRGTTQWDLQAELGDCKIVRGAHEVEGVDAASHFPISHQWHY
jgi:hypothetical protein